MLVGMQSTAVSLIAELDQRQNDVIRELDVLNERIDNVIKNWCEDRSDESASSVP